MGTIRKYFILDRTFDLNEFEALETCIGKNWTQRYSSDCSKLLVKTTANIDKELVAKLGNEYSLKEIKIILRTPEWQEEETDVNI